MLLILSQLPEISCGIGRDLVVIVRFFAIFLNFYLAYIIGKRIKEAGGISGTTGFMFYLFGNGLFQAGISIFVLYPGERWAALTYIGTIFIYFVSMSVYSILAELDLKRNPIPNGKSTKFIYSIIAIIGLILFPVISIYNPNNLSYGFFYMLFPFIASSGTFFDRFKNMEIIRQSRPAFWFSLGMGIAGFSNFFISNIIFDFMFTFVLQAFMVIGGSLLMVKGWSTLPPLSELSWYLKMEKLMVSLQDGIPIYAYGFQSDAPNSGADTDGVLAGGALSGVQSILSEILKSKEGINQIDHGDKTIYFYHGQKATYILFTHGKAEEFHERLEKFSRLFELQFNKELKGWNGNVSVFSAADPLTKDVFHP